LSEDVQKLIHERIEAIRKLKILCAICGTEAPSIFTHWYTLSGEVLGKPTIIKICDKCFKKHILPLIKYESWRGES